MDEKSFQTKASSTEEDVIGFYNAYADTWDGRFGDAQSNTWFLERRWRAFADALERASVARHSAVELGVGTGVYIAKTSALFEKIVAVDGSEKMLAVLKKRLGQQGITNVDVLHSNVLELSALGTESADCVYFFGLIEHIINLDAFVAEIGRVLKPRGVVIGVTPNGGSPWYLFRRIFRGTGKHCSSDTYHSEKSLDQVFLPHGFSKVYVCHWGAVPAGANGLLAKLLFRLEPLLEASPMRKLLGGLTFVYRRWA